MKRILVSAIIAAASINAYAESNVTLYGVIDQAVAVTKHKHEAAKVRIDDGIYAGSRFGIKGTEDLGNGNEVRCWIHTDQWDGDKEVQLNAK